MSNLYYDLPKPINSIVTDLANDGIRFKVNKRYNERYNYTRWIEWERIQSEYDSHDEELSSECYESDLLTCGVLDDETIISEFLDFKRVFNADHAEDEKYNTYDDDDEEYSYDNDNMHKLKKLKDAYVQTTDFLNRVKNNSCSTATKYYGKYDDLNNRLLTSGTGREDENGKHISTYIFNKKWRDPPDTVYVVWYNSGGGCGCGCFTTRYPVRLYKNKHKADNFCQKFKNYWYAKNFSDSYYEQYDDNKGFNVNMYEFKYDPETEQYTTKDDRV